MLIDFTKETYAQLKAFFVLVYCSCKIAWTFRKKPVIEHEEVGYEAADSMSVIGLKKHAVEQGKYIGLKRDKE